VGLQIQQYNNTGFQFGPLDTISDSILLKPAAGGLLKPAAGGSDVAPEPDCAMDIPGQPGFSHEDQVEESLRRMEQA